MGQKETQTPRLINLLEGCTEVHPSAGDRINLSEDHGMGVLFVKTGIVAITTQEDDPRLVRIAYPGDMLNLVDTYPGGILTPEYTRHTPSNFCAHIVGNAELARANITDIQRALSEAAVISALNYERYRTLKSTEETAVWLNSNLAARLAKMILRIHTVSSDTYRNKLTPCVHMKQDYIALLCSGRRETISTILAVWREEEIIDTRYRAIIIRDREALQKICHSLPDYLPEFQS